MPGIKEERLHMQQKEDEYWHDLLDRKKTLQRESGGNFCVWQIFLLNAEAEVRFRVTFLAPQVVSLENNIPLGQISATLAWSNLPGQNPTGHWKLHLKSNWTW